jgi:hypothetical protein
MYTFFIVPYQTGYQFPIPGSAGHSNSGGGSNGPSKQATSAAQKDGMWTDRGSVKDSDTESLENIGNEKMPSNLNGLGTWGQGTTRGDAEWHAAQFGEVNYRDSGDWGSAYAQGSTDVLKVEGRAFGDAGYKDGSYMASGGVQGRVELIGAHYQGGYTSPTLFNFGGHDITSRTTFNGDASVGATATVQGGIALGKNDYVQLGANGFAGASATVKGSESLGDVASVNGCASGYVGIGAKGDLDVGYKDGELNFNFGLGFAWGIGYSLDFGFSVNPGAIADGIYDGAGDACKWVGNEAEDAGKWVGNKAEDAGKAVGNAVEDAGKAVGNAVSDAVGDICDLF